MENTNVITHYTDIEDFSLHNWRKCNAGKFAYTRIKWDEGSEEEDLKAWDSLQDSFIAEFGISEELQYAFDLRKEVALLYCEVAETGDRFLLNRIAVLEHQISEIVNDDTGASLADCIGYVSKWIGSVVNPKEVSTKDFYSWLRTMQAENDKLRNKQKDDHSG